MPSSLVSKILIGGYYGYGNAGDEAILAAMLRELRVLRPDLDLAVASGDPLRTRSEHGVRAVPAADLTVLSAAIAESDLVVLGGGGLFQDYWDVPTETLLTARQGGLLSYLAYPVLAALLNRPAVIYAVGVGPLATAEGRRLTRIAFELCRRATVRDAPSLALLAEIGFAGPVELAADPAFLLTPAPEAETTTLLSALGVGGEPLIGVALRHWDFGVEPGRWETEVARGLDLHLAAYPGKLLFLPFQSEGGERYENDLAVSRRVAGALQHADRVVVVERPLRPEALAGLVGRCERVLAMRFHSALFALAAGVPAACLAYDPKVESLMVDAGLPELALPPSLWRGDEVAQALGSTARPELRERLAGFGSEKRRLARRSAELALEALEEGPAARSETSEARRFLDELALAKAASVRELEAELRRVQQARDVALAESHSHLTASRSLLATRETELAELRQAWQERGRKLDEAWAAHRGMREQRDMMLHERNDLARRLGAVEATAAYGLLSRFWALMRRLFPEGSRRRAVYRGGRAFLRRLLHLKPPSSPGLLQPEEVPGGEGAPDPRGDLLSFEEWVRASGASRIVTLLSATQLLESEGQRPTQLALELARRGIPVVFCYWRWWPHEWCAQDRLEEGIVQIPIDVVLARPEMLAGAFAGMPSRLALFEFPYPGFFELLAAFNAEGWITVYDVLDDWQEFHRVGQAVWYDEPFERHLAGAADAVFAINEILAGRIRELGGEGVAILGNGLKPGLEAIQEPRPLDRGEVTVGYFGYLAGAWFDWELVAEAARRRPAWRFYLIGYGGSPEGIELPGNVTLLGKKPQGELAAFAANWDVAIIPFKPDRLAAGADPIKTYEYLAMGLPVVATGVYPPAGGEAFVTRAEGAGAFLDALAAAAAEGPERAAARRAFAASCTWGGRLDILLAAVERGEQRVAEKRALAGLGTGEAS